MLLGETEDFSKALSTARACSHRLRRWQGWLGVLWFCVGFSFFPPNVPVQKNSGRNRYISRESTAWDEASFRSKPKISVTGSCMLLQACTRAPSALSPGGTCGPPRSLVTRDRSRLVSLNPNYLAYDGKKAVHILFLQPLCLL